MTGRRGFTLVELVTAVTATALAGLVAAAALQAASGAGDRVTRSRRTAEADAQARTLLTDALRHLPPASAVEGPVLALEADSAGPVLAFPSRGVVPPFGTGSAWRVTARRRGDSLVVDALPPASLAAAPRHAAVGGVAAFTVRVFDGEASGGWRTDWPLAERPPRAVELAWRTATDTPPPVRVLLAPLGAGGVP